MAEFTSVLYDLFVRQGLELAACLLIMSRRNVKLPGQYRNMSGKRKITGAAQYLYESLENGNLFSNSLKTCRFISFDEVYISFIRLAEKSGDLKSAVTYLHEKLERCKKNRQKIFMVSLYPFFVVCASVAACVLVGVMTNTEKWGFLLRQVFILIFVCAAIYVLILYLLGDSKLTEAFVAVDFLVKKGIDVAAAVECAVQITGPSTLTGRKFEEARRKLEYGMNLQSAFCCSGKIGEAFYYADVAGNQNDIFSRVAFYLREENEHRRTVCMALVEPLFILITGVFLLSLLMEYFMPFINGFEI